MSDQTPTRTTLGALLRRLRTEAGLSQDGLALLANSSQPKVSQLELGLYGASVDVCWWLALALGVDPMTLIEAAGLRDQLPSTRLGRVLCECRAHRGWSKNELARKARLRPATVGGYETEGTTPAAPVLWRLARTLDADPLRLLEAAAADAGEAV